MNITENLKSIQEQIAAAAEKAGRAPEEVRLVAVSKTKPLSMIEEAKAAGQLDFGENRAQELQEKGEQLNDVRWHMIGHIQRNKVKYLAPFVHLIHSVDSPRLLKEISKRAGQNERTIDCLLQLNISEEENKSGLNEVSARELLEKIDDYPHVRIMGLMGMAEFTDDQEVVRKEFQRLAGAFKSYQDIAHPRIQMKELSMGMSGDFEVAIEEGATLVRIGTAVFGARG